MFVHFLNDQILNIYGLRNKYSEILLAEKLKDALIYLLFFREDELFIPTVDLIQSPSIYHIQNILNELACHELINFVGSANDPNSIIKEKYKHFKGTGIHSLWFEKNIGRTLEIFSPYFSKRVNSTTNEMKLIWSNSLDNINASYTGLILKNILKQKSGLIITEDINILKTVPERLEDSAFLWSIIENKNIINDFNININKTKFELLLAYIWICTYFEEYGYDLVSNIPGIGVIDCGLRNHKQVNLIDLKRVKKVLSWIGLTYAKLINCSIEDIVILLTSMDYHFIRNRLIIPLYNGDINIDVFNIKSNESYSCIDIIKYHTDILFKKNIQSVNTYSENLIQKEINMDDKKKKRIFLGHGRSKVWLELKDFIETRLEFSWDEFNRTPVAGKTVTQRLEEMLNEAGFAFIILTAEDEHADGTKHARENATHEAGLFQGRLGVEKAIILLEEGCNEFSNIKGLNQLRFPKDNIKAISEDIRLILEERF